MIKAIGILVRTVNITNHPFAVALPEGNFLVWDDDLLNEEDYGKEALVKYDPQDQFCHYIGFVSREAEKESNPCTTTQTDPS